MTSAVTLVPNKSHSDLPGVGTSAHGGRQGGGHSSTHNEDQITSVKKIQESDIGEQHCCVNPCYCVFRANDWAAYSCFARRTEYLWEGGWVGLWMEGGQSPCERSIPASEVHLRARPLLFTEPRWPAEKGWMPRGLGAWQPFIHPPSVGKGAYGVIVSLSSAQRATDCLLIAKPSAGDGHRGERG